jgi:hypothetical protein
MTIDPREAASALSDIEDIARRVRQSSIYYIASIFLIVWGALVVVGNTVSFLWPGHAGYIWTAVNVVGIAACFAISAFCHVRTGVRSFDIRTLIAFLLFFAFGFFCVRLLGHFTPRQTGTFWPVYFMLVYTIAGLWIGFAFVAIGLGITALTLVGYFFAGNWFEPWMAVANGGGLMLGGLWMRRS